MPGSLALKLSKLPFLKPKDSIAVDIGTSSVKIVYLKNAGQKYTVVKWGILPLILSETIESTPEERKSAIVAAIGEFFAREKIVLKNMVTSVSGHQVIVRYVRFPKLTHDELAKTIVFEAEPYIPFDIKEVDVGFHIMGDVVEEGQKKMETILVAAKKEAVQSRLDVFNELGLRLVMVDVDAFALQNAYLASIDPLTEDVVMLVNIGSMITNIAIVEKTISKVVRDIFIAGSSFTKGIQRTMACEPAHADELKKKYGILATPEDRERTVAENNKESMQVSQAITSVARELLTEIQRSIDFYVSQNPDKTITKVLLSGGSCYLKDINSYLAHELKIPVERFNPFKGIVGGEMVPEEMAQYFAIAVGLGMRRERDNEG